MKFSEKYIAYNWYCKSGYVRVGEIYTSYKVRLKPLKYGEKKTKTLVW